MWVHGCQCERWVRDDTIAALASVFMHVKSKIMNMDIASRGGMVANSSNVVGVGNLIAYAEGSIYER